MNKENYYILAKLPHPNEIYTFILVGRSYGKTLAKKQIEKELTNIEKHRKEFEALK